MRQFARADCLGNLLRSAALQCNYMESFASDLARRVLWSLGTMANTEKKSPRLRLNRETFRRLTTNELNVVNGGWWSSTGPTQDDTCGCSVFSWESSLGPNANHIQCRTAAP